MINFKSTAETRAVFSLVRDLRNEGSFIHPAIPYTSPVLCNEIINNIKMVDKTSSIAVLFTIEMAAVLRSKGFNNITVITDAHCDVTIKLAHEINCVYKTLEDLEDMKFDVVVGNPPYSKDNKNLYPTFFKSALELADVAVMVMPYNSAGWQDKLKSHNKLVHTHSTLISKNVKKWFPTVGLPDIRYIMASATVVNEVPNRKNPLTNHTKLLPERGRIFARRGLTDFTRPVNWDEQNGIPVINSVHRGDKIIWCNVKKEIAIKNKPSMNTSAPWLVLVMEHPSNGYFNIAIIENDGTKWGSGIFAIDATTEDEAKTIKGWLKSEVIQKEVQTLLALKNAYSFSGVMMQMLPHYK